MINEYPISKNVNEILQIVISWLDYYTMLKGNIKLLIPIDSPRSQLSKMYRCSRYVKEEARYQRVHAPKDDHASMPIV